MRKHELDQNFLKPYDAMRFVDRAHFSRDDVLLDIGAGEGAITHALTLRGKMTYAIEKDHETAEKLRARMIDLEQKNHAAAAHINEYMIRHRMGTLTARDWNYEIIEQDFLDFDLTSLPYYKVFANPPFSLSSEIIHKLISSDNPPDAMYLILQKQFALKLLNTDRHYTSQLGEELISKYKTRIDCDISKNSFTPPPAVPIVLFVAEKIPQTPEELARLSKPKKSKKKHKPNKPQA